jgi:hypothetical protein
MTALAYLFAMTPAESSTSSIATVKLPEALSPITDMCPASCDVQGSAAAVMFWCLWFSSTFE